MVITPNYEKISLPSGKFRHILSKQGVQQGDPLGPFLFALGMQHSLLIPVNKVLQQHGMGIGVSYLDDLVLTGEPNAVSIAYNYLVAEGTKFGLIVNSKKS